MILAVWGIPAIIYSGNVGAAARMNTYKRMSALPDSYVEGIERGEPTGPTKLDGMILFHMRADLAHVYPADGGAPSPGVASITNKTALFLGAADGTSVFYDASAHAAATIPTNSAGPIDPAYSVCGYFISRGNWRADRFAACQASRRSTVTGSCCVRGGRPTSTSF
ncbi:hypothetical protein ACIA5C_25470 [Actinoplanes sp. NPDC051343]|uniref:hypothetical protein n=1 Tax=Actinoplanes sp. NPDC051343 TaxID=3363906 RepID=UPI0037A2306F